MTQLAFVIDLKRCIGCDTCVVGCKVEHRLPEGAFRLQVFDAERAPTPRRPQGGHPVASQNWLPTMCHNCSDAPCADVCPTTALWRRDEDGLIVLEKDKCVGCQRCGEACPYDALSFDAHTGTADKCTACDHRRDEGPACATVCPTGAIHFGDLHDTDSKVHQLLATHEHRRLNESSQAQSNIYYLAP